MIFVLLEFLAFYVLVKKNDFQRSRYFNTSVALMAKSYSVTSSVDDYFGLKPINDLLATENVNLLNKIDSLQSHLDRLTNDSIVLPVQRGFMTYIGAKVIYNSVYHIQNYIIIDKGSDDGVQPDMGVMSANGVVGVVQRTSKHYAVVLPIINPDMKISAKIKSNNQLGSIGWDGESPTYAIMDEIPRHVKPVSGDSIVTSGYSAIFPEGLFIGNINKAESDPNDPFCRIKIDLAVDFQSLNYVVVTAYDNKEELFDLYKSVGIDEK